MKNRKISINDSISSSPKISWKKSARRPSDPRSLPPEKSKNLSEIRNRGFWEINGRKMGPTISDRNGRKIRYEFNFDSSHIKDQIRRYESFESLGRFSKKDHIFQFSINKIYRINKIIKLVWKIHLSFFGWLMIEYFLLIHSWNFFLFIYPPLGIIDF